MTLRRHTKSKDQILSLFDKHHTLSAKEVATLLPNIDFSTIYRNIQKFVEDGLLRETNVSPGVVSYEKTDDLHDHFICDECNEVEVVHLDEKVLKSNLPKGFEPTLGKNIIHGVCKDCN